jgi:hypothetical protein
MYVQCKFTSKLFFELFFIGCFIGYLVDNCKVCTYSARMNEEKPKMGHDSISRLERERGIQSA